MLATIKGSSNCSERNSTLAKGEHATFTAYWNPFSEQNDLAQIGKAHAYIIQELEAAMAQYEELEKDYLQAVPTSGVLPPAPVAPLPVPPVHVFVDEVAPRFVLCLRFGALSTSSANA
jgi:hypothetical protein